MTHRGGRITVPLFWPNESHFHPLAVLSGNMLEVTSQRISPEKILVIIIIIGPDHNHNRKRFEQSYTPAPPQVMELNESPILLLLNPKIDHDRKDIPVTIYETGRLGLEGSSLLVLPGCIGVSASQAISLNLQVMAAGWKVLQCQAAGCGWSISLAAGLGCGYRGL